MEKQFVNVFSRYYFYVCFVSNPKQRSFSCLVSASFFLFIYFISLNTYTFKIIDCFSWLLLRKPILQGAFLSCCVASSRMSARARRKEGINSDCCDQEPSSKDHAIYTADLATLGKVHATSHMTKVRSWRRAWWVPRLAFLNTLVALYIIWHHIRSLGLVESPPHAVKSTPATLRVTRFASGKLASPLAPGNWSRLTPVEPMPRQMADGQVRMLKRLSCQSHALRMSLSIM